MKMNESQLLVNKVNTWISMKIKQVAASRLVKVEKLARVSQSGPDKERLHGQFRLCVHPVSTSEAASEARLYKKTHENVEHGISNLYFSSAFFG